jgi:hypothetical protein
MVDKLLELLNASTKVGFALVFSVAAFLIGRAFGFWAVSLDASIYLCGGTYLVPEGVTIAPAICRHTEQLTFREIWWAHQGSMGPAD